MPAKNDPRTRALAQIHRQKTTSRHPSLLLHWVYRMLRQPRHTMAMPLPEVRDGQMALSFGGHATVLVRYRSLNVACDPMVGNWCRGIKREVAPGLTSKNFQDVDLVLLSSLDPDHMHLPTLATLPRRATVIGPQGCAQHLSELQFAQVVQLDPDQYHKHRDITVSALAAQGDGPSLGYVVRGPGPSFVYFGATGYFDQFAEIGERFQPDVALLPIGGYLPLSFRQRNMSPLDAVLAFEEVRARVMIPIRHAAFSLSYERIDAPAQWLRELIVERGLHGHVLEMAPGESRVFVRPGPSLRHGDARPKSVAASDPISAAHR